MKNEKKFKEKRSIAHNKEIDYFDSSQPKWEHLFRTNILSIFLFCIQTSF